MAPERQAKARRFSSELSTSDISDSSSYSASSSHLRTCVLTARELEPWHALTEAPEPLSWRSDRLVLSARVRRAKQQIRPRCRPGGRAVAPHRGRIQQAALHAAAAGGTDPGAAAPTTARTSASCSVVRTAHEQKPASARPPPPRDLARPRRSSCRAPARGAASGAHRRPWRTRRPRSPPAAAAAAAAAWASSQMPRDQARPRP